MIDSDGIYRQRTVVRDRPFDLKLAPDPGEVRLADGRHDESLSTPFGDRLNAWSCLPASEAKLWVPFSVNFRCSARRLFRRERHISQTDVTILMKTRVSTTIISELTESPITFALRSHSTAASVSRANPSRIKSTPSAVGNIITGFSP